MRPKRITPGPGQESVWDYPRPPRLEDCPKQIRILVDGVTIVDSSRSKRVLETSHAPVYYIPPVDIRLEYVHGKDKQSWCEWKGMARYYDVKVGERLIADAAWGYPLPTAGFESMANYLAFYVAKMDACYLDDEQVHAQPGEFYGGWISSDVVGPFKGDVGTMGW